MNNYEKCPVFVGRKMQKSKQRNREEKEKSFECFLVILSFACV